MHLQLSSEENVDSIIKSYRICTCAGYAVLDLHADVLMLLIFLQFSLHT